MDYKILREEKNRRRLDIESERLRRREGIEQKRIEDREKRNQQQYERDERISEVRKRRDEKIKEREDRIKEREDKKSCKNCWKLWGGNKENYHIQNTMRDINYRIEKCIQDPCTLSEEECIFLIRNKLEEYKRIMSIGNPIKRTNALYDFEQEYCNKNVFHQIGGGGVKLDGYETGAGVVLVEKYLNHARTREEDAVILFRDKYSGKYNDGGGKIDPGETVKQSARRELKEESENLFRLSLKSLNLKLAVRNQSYISFFVRVNANNHVGIQSKYYQSNRRSLKKGNVPDHWLETDKMTRVYVTDLINNNISTLKGEFKVNDANGNPIIIEGKTKAVLKEGIRNNIIKMTSPQTLKINTKCIDKEIPHVSTVCYWT